MSSADQVVSEPAVEAPDQLKVKGEDTVGRKVFIGNLSYTATEEELKSFVGTAEGTLESVELANRWNGRAAGYAFAVWATADEAEAAVVKLDKQTLNEREIHVAIANGPSEKTPRQKKPKTKVTDDNTENTNPDESAPLANSEGGEIQASAPPKKKRNNKKKRSARRLPSQDNDEVGPETTAITASTDESHPADAVGPTSGAGEDQKKPRAKRTRKPKSPKAVKEEGESTEQARIDDDKSTEKKDLSGDLANETAPRRVKTVRPRVATTGEPSSTLIFVANLPFSVDDEQLSDMFTNLDIGIKSAKVITKPQTSRKGGEGVRSKGFGFVEAETHEQQTLALEKLQGHMIGEREIVVKVANERVSIEGESDAQTLEDTKPAEQVEETKPSSA